MNNFEMGFTSETKAPDIIYQLEIFLQPKSPSEFTLLNQDPIVEKFNDNQIINSISEVTLQTSGDNTFKNFINVCSIKVDTSRRGTPTNNKGFYSSALNLY